MELWQKHQYFLTKTYLYLMRIFMFNVNIKIDKNEVTTLEIILPKCVCIREWHKLLFRLFTRVIKLLVQIDSICSILQIQFKIPIVLLLFLEMNWVAEHMKNYILIKYPNSSYSILKKNWLNRRIIKIQTWEAIICVK